MAERRMFAKSIIESDAFLDMTISARCLYYTMGMYADDDGVVSNPKSIMRLCGAKDEDLQQLIDKRYLLSFPSGIVIIKHWKINNLIQKDRYKHTTYIEEFDTLSLDKKGAYIESCIQDVSKIYPDCIQNVSKMETQVSIGKDSIDKDSIGKDSISIVSKKVSKNNNNLFNNTHIQSYEELLDDLMVEESVKPMVFEFIKHCQLNGKSVTNSKLSNIMLYMDEYGYSEEQKIKALKDAISGGYFDIKRTGI